MVNTLVASVLVVGMLAQGRTSAPPPRPDLRKVVEDQAKEIADLKRRVAELEERLNQLTPRQAGKDGRPAVGMTLADVSALMRQFPLAPDEDDPLKKNFGEAKLVSQSPDGDEYEWRFGVYIVNGTFRDGKLAAWTLQEPPPGKAPRGTFRARDTNLN